MAGWIGRVPEVASCPRAAQAITFLAPPAGAYIRGQSLAVDGGRLNTIQGEAMQFDIFFSISQTPVDGVTPDEATMF